MADTKSRTWFFLLPDTGAHEFRVENLGSADQRCFINGAFLECPPGTTLFTGPGASLLELRKGPSGRWQLLVNGSLVEDYNAGKHSKGDENSIRELRSMGEGSYTIAAKFAAESVGLKVVRKFRFIALDAFHEIEIAHKDWIWHFLYNGQVLDRLTHSMGEDKCKTDFTVDIPGGRRLFAEIRMEWAEAKRLWSYALAINHMPVPTYWTMAGGYDNTVMPPEILDNSPSAADRPVIATEEQEVPLPVDLSSMPQGVSYDATSRVFQANIKVKGRFMFLGEFKTPEEAHERWREENEKLKSSR